MGTRSTVGFRSGNEVRYIYVATDGFRHGATLEKLGHYNCLKLWEQIGDAEKAGRKVYLSHLSDADDADWAWCAEQPNARTPVVATGPNWSKKYLESNGHWLSGVIKVETYRPNKLDPFDLMHIIGMEGTVWLYDLDDDRVYFMGDPGLAEDLVYNHKPRVTNRVAEAIIEF